ncbi:hypothetical protein M758_UG066600 [Ceratodon purpureus]|nr:hypothetical protein M758_UG066600 [Ceratodon purpureus]
MSLMPLNFSLSSVIFEISLYAGAATSSSTTCVFTSSFSSTVGASSMAKTAPVCACRVTAAPPVLVEAVSLTKLVRSNSDFRVLQQSCGAIGCSTALPCAVALPWWVDDVHATWRKGCRECCCRVPLTERLLCVSLFLASSLFLLAPSRVSSWECCGKVLNNRLKLRVPGSSCVKGCDL